MLNAMVDGLDSLARLPVRQQWEVFGALLTDGQFDVAGRLLDRLATEPPSAMVLHARQRLAQRRGDHAALLDAVWERATRYPQPANQADLVLALIDADQVPEAAQILTTALASHPQNVDLTVAATHLALTSHDTALAQRTAQQAAALAPNHVGVQCALARVAWASDEHVAARDRLAAVLTNLADQAAPADLELVAATADALDQPQVAADLRARVSAYWQRRRDATWQAVRTALGAAPAAAPPVQPDGTPAPPLEPAAATRPLDPLTTTEDGLPDDVMRIVRDSFGHASLRPGQAAVLRQVLAGVDTLATMPTGAGKSLCYQVAALARPGTTLVISPLIALMKDQVDSLPPDVAPLSTLINSTLDPGELRARLDEARAGRYKLIYVAPERLRSSGFLSAMRAAGVGLIVVDEAHCISLWGHDFRPDYLFIPQAAAALGDPPLLAMTATATSALAADIERQMRRPLQQVRTSVFRPNLRYVVQRVENREAKFRAVLDLCQRTTGPGIIYAASREACEQIATMLRRERVQADFYHAGLERDRRAAVQDAFMHGRVRVIVATVAFGMGVDKRNVRFIVHFSPSKSLEAYAQESGRAGRDGGNALCLLLYAPADLSNLRRWNRDDQIDAATVREAHRRLTAQARRDGSRWLIANPEVTLGDVVDPESDVDIQVVIGMLERAGLLQRHPDAPRTLVLRRPSTLPPAPDELLGRAIEHLGNQGTATPVLMARLAEAVDLAPADLERQIDDWLATGDLIGQMRERDACLELLPELPDAHRRIDQVLIALQQENVRRLKSLEGYLGARTCRHVVLAAHFGEQIAACGDACDICSRGDPTSAREMAQPAPKQPTATSATAADAAAVIEAVRTLPFGVGKTGLARLLAGSVQSAIKADRSASFGALEHLRTARIEDLIEKLVEAGILHRDTTTEYRLLTLTRAGADADEAALAPLLPRPAPARPAASGSDSVGSATSSDDLDEDEQELFERLRQWRTETAAAAGVPAYVVMHNAVLRQLVISRPATRADLETIPGLGPVKSERYGAALLEMLTQPVDHP